MNFISRRKPEILEYYEEPQNEESQNHWALSSIVKLLTTRLILVHKVAGHVTRTNQLKLKKSKTGGEWMETNRNQSKSIETKRNQWKPKETIGIETDQSQRERERRPTGG